MRNINQVIFHILFTLSLIMVKVVAAEPADKCELETLNHSAQKKSKSIFFLNGLTSSARLYAPLIARLSLKDFNLITLNIPPTGNSQTGEDHDWDTIQGCLFKFFNKQNDYILVMHDLSSALMLPLFENLKQQPKGIVLMNALIRPSEYKFSYPFSLMQDRLSGKVTSQVFPEFLYKKEILKVGMHDEMLITADVLNDLFKDTLGGKSSSVAELIQSYPSSPDKGQRIKHALQNPKIKQLIIWGLQDPIMKNQLQFLDETSQHPHRDSYFIKEGKHFLMWEYPEEISSVIKSWIQKHKM